MATLTHTELETLKTQLRAEYERLVSEVREELIQSGEQHYIDLAGRVTDTGDESVADALADLDAAMIDRHIHELREIESALARVAAGTCGVCVDCAGPVGFARLKAYPTAVRCIDCQDRHDKQFAHENRPTL
jgi:RNA polymerase-binding protein DksA